MRTLPTGLNQRLMQKLCRKSARKSASLDPIMRSISLTRSHSTDNSDNNDKTDKDVKGINSFSDTEALERLADPVGKPNGLRTWPKLEKEYQRRSSGTWP